MQPSGKGTRTDADAYAYLLPYSSFGTNAVRVRDDGTVDALHTSAWNDQMQQVKNDVSRLDTHALLHRDLKITSVHTSSGHDMRVGLATVPLSLSAWISGAYHSDAPLRNVRDDEAAQEWEVWWHQLASFMRESRLDMAVVLLSYRERRDADSTSADADARPKSRRDLALAMHGAVAPTHALERVASALKAHGAQGDGVSFDLAPWKGQRRSVASGKRERAHGVQPDHTVPSVPGMAAVVWRQRNARANRKLVQPALMRIIQSLL